ncbi:hypothetical protein QQX13_09440 [Demequina sp. SYSU T00068]|uniref:hypothetical protein n=1 Tax=Demequina lignilytica TaxID=3051663 RepID=UPI00260A6891|nr:hypothetical protein [Demequina sp. SYSU T00068]MDN4491052.1 hypothetical protein [Demequina sp. SYSU T00068]
MSAPVDVEATAVPGSAGPDTAPRRRGTDISQLVGLHTSGALAILGVYLISNVAFVATTADILVHPWASWLAVALVSVGGVVVSRPHPDPFSSRLTYLVMAIVVVSTVLVAYALPDSGSLGRATWHLGANTWLLWFLILRRRIIRAWITGVLMLLITMAWAELSGRGLVSGLMLASPQVMLLLIATLFGAGLRRSTARINALAQRSLDAAAAAGAVEAARRIQDQRADELAEVAVPVLTAIATGAALTDDARAEIIRVEAQLRDSVRGRGLAMPAVVAAATRARERGVEVTLLDDRNVPLTGEESLAVVSAVVSALDSVVSGNVTARLLPVGREELLTLVSQCSDGETQRVVVAADAEV